MPSEGAYDDAYEHPSTRDSVDSDSDGPHKQIRREAIATIEKTRARMVRNYNRQSKVHHSKIGDRVGIKIDRSDRGHCDRKFVPCLIIDVNNRKQFQLRCQDGVIDTRFTAGDLQPFPSNFHFSFAAEDSTEGVPHLKLVGASRKQSYAIVTAVSCNCRSLKCSTNQCKCFRAGVDCTARCHAGRKCQHWGQH